MPERCELESVLGLHSHAGVQQGNASSSLDHAGDHGFSVSRLGTDPRDLGVSMHWWHTGVSGIFVRAVYIISEEDGADCSVAGVTQDNF